MLQATRLASSFALLLCSCAAQQSATVTLESGTIVAPGYVHHAPEKPRDTPTASGSLSNISSGLSIAYSIFSYTVAADPKLIAQTGQRVLWTRTIGSGLQRHIETLYQDDYGNRTFCISFLAGPTNFFVESPTDESMRELRRIASSFRYRASPNATQ